MNRKNVIILAATIAGLLGSAMVAPASTVSVAVGQNPSLLTTDSAGVAPATNWNDVALSTFVAPAIDPLGTLKDSTGAASIISGIISHGGYYPAVGMNFPAGSGDEKLYSGNAISYSQPDIIVSLTGLDPTANYELYVYAQSVFNFGPPTSASVGSTTFWLDGPTSHTLSAYTLANATTSGTAIAGNYFDFGGITGSSTLSFTVGSHGGSNNADALSGFQLVSSSGIVVPEPASLGIISAGSLLILRRRRTA